jgi:hypothetical protein
MNRSIPIPLAALGLGLTQGCPAPDEPEPLVGEWEATLVADQVYPYHDEETWPGPQYAYTVITDRTAELEIYADLSGYFDMFTRSSFEYGANVQESEFGSYQTVQVSSIEADGNYKITLWDDGFVAAKLECSLTETNATLRCIDGLEREWAFERR